MDPTEHIPAAQSPSSSKPPSSQSCQDDSDVEGEMVSLKPESESDPYVEGEMVLLKPEPETDSKSTDFVAKEASTVDSNTVARQTSTSGSDVTDSKLPTTTDETETTSDTSSLADVPGVKQPLLEWLKYLSKFWSCISAISLCVLSVDKTFAPKFVELLAKFLSEKENLDDCMDAAKEVIRKGRHNEGQENLVEFLKHFTKDKLEEWDDEKCLKLVEGTSSTEKKLLLKSLENVFASLDQNVGSDLKGDFKKLLEKSQRVQTDLQESAIEILSNCDDKLVSQIESELDSMYPDADKWSDEFKAFFGKQPVDQANIRELLTSKTLSEREVLFDALYRATSSADTHEYVTKKEMKGFRKWHGKRLQQKQGLDKIAKEMYEGKGATRNCKYLKKILSDGKSKIFAEAYLATIVKGIENNNITEELLKRVAYISGMNPQSDEETKFLSKWNEYRTAHEELKENAILILSSRDLKLYEALIKKLDDAITLRGRSLNIFRDFFAKREIIARDSVQTLLKGVDDNDDLYEVLKAILRQLPTQDLPAAEVKTMQDLKTVDSDLCHILLRCKCSWPDKFIEELKKHVICNAISDASLSTGKLIEAMEYQNAEIVKIGKEDLDCMKQLAVVRNGVVHMFFEITSDEQRESFIEKIRSIAITTKQAKEVEDIILVVGSTEAAKYIEHCIGLVEKNERNKEEISDLTAEVDKLKRVSKTQADIIEERDQKVQRVMENNRVLSNEVHELREMAERMIAKSDYLNLHLVDLKKRQKGFLRHCSGSLRNYDFI